MASRSGRHRSKRIDQQVETIGVDSGEIRSLLSSEAGDSFFRATIYMGAGPAAKLFSDTGRNHGDIENSASLFEYLCSGILPFYSFDRLQASLNSLIKHQIENASSIIATGKPQIPFTTCDWMGRHLSCLYPRANLDQVQLSDGWLTLSDAQQLRSKRPELLELKIDLLKLLASAISTGSADSLWQDIEDHLKSRFNATDILLCLKADMLDTAFADDSARDVCADLPGGLANILTVAGHVEQEIKIGAMSKTYELISEGVTQTVLGNPNAYYEIAASIGHKVVDRAEQTYNSLSAEEACFWNHFAERLLTFVDGLTVNLSSAGPRGLNVMDNIRRYCEDYIDWLSWYAGFSTSNACSDCECSVEAAQGTFRKDGDYWTLQFAGRTALLKDSPGLRILSCLLKHASEEIHVFELAYSIDGGPASATNTTFSGREDVAELSTVESEEDCADKEYLFTLRRELIDAKEFLEDAKRSGDPAQISFAQKEFDKIRDVAKTTLGKNGRSRKFNSNAERCRKRVGNAISRAVEAIGKKHPELHQHLTASLQSSRGWNPSYSPQAAIDWTLD